MYTSFAKHATTDDLPGFKDLKEREKRTFTEEEHSFCDRMPIDTKRN